MICPSNPLQDVPTTYLANAMHFTAEGATGRYTILMTKRNHIRNPANVPYLLESRSLFYQSVQHGDEPNGVYYAAFHDVWHTSQYHEGRAARLTLTRHGPAGSNALMFDGSVRPLTVAEWNDRTLDDGVRNPRFALRLPRIEPP
jgi:prepilin-type processing-associated H-X9-DG protein